jgi:hypothetical protein
MSVFGKSQKSKQKVSYLSLEKARISFVPEQDIIQLTGNLEGLSFKQTIPAGSSLESEFRNALLLQEDDYRLKASQNDEKFDSKNELPEIAILNFGSKKHLSFEDVKRSPEIRYAKHTKTNVINHIDDFPQQEDDLRIPLGLVQNLYNQGTPKVAFHKPFRTFAKNEDGEFLPRNVFLTGMPGRGKSILAQSIAKSMATLAPDVEVVLYDPKGSHEADYGVDTSLDLLGFFVKIREILLNSSRKQYFVIIEELDTLIQFPHDQNWFEKRANKAIRAELLEAIIFLSQHSLNVSFVFSSQNPGAEHNGILATCDTIVDFGNNMSKPGILGHPAWSVSERKPQGRSYIKQGDNEDRKIFQPYLSVDIA